MLSPHYCPQNLPVRFISRYWQFSSVHMVVSEVDAQATVLSPAMLHLLKHYLRQVTDNTFLASDYDYKYTAILIFLPVNSLVEILLVQVHITKGISCRLKLHQTCHNKSPHSIWLSPDHQPHILCILLSNNVHKIFWHSKQSQFELANQQRLPIPSSWCYLGYPTISGHAHLRTLIWRAVSLHSGLHDNRHCQRTIIVQVISGKCNKQVQVPQTRTPPDNGHKSTLGNQQRTPTKTATTSPILCIHPKVSTGLSAEPKLWKVWSANLNLDMPHGALGGVVAGSRRDFGLWVNRLLGFEC